LAMNQAPTICGLVVGALAWYMLFACALDVGALRHRYFAEAFVPLLGLLAVLDGLGVLLRQALCSFARSRDGSARA
jgi:hypothetical protein